MRDADATKQRLIEAVDALIVEQGIGALGVNAVAQQAGVDKVLIYRYFGGWSGLLQAYAEGEAFWPSTQDLLGECPKEILALPPAERWQLVLSRYVRELSKRPRTLEILAWEVTARNEITARLEAVREKRALELLSHLGDGCDPDVDLGALAAILSAAVHYLLLRGREIRGYSGIDLQSEAGWQRLEQTMARLLTAYFQSN